jgi:hypothetical protein
MTDNAKTGKPDVLDAVKRLLERVPAEPVPMRPTPAWRQSTKKTSSDSLY